MVVRFLGHIDKCSYQICILNWQLEMDSTVFVHTKFLFFQAVKTIEKTQSRVTSVEKKKKTTHVQKESQS